MKNNKNVDWGIIFSFEMLIPNMMLISGIIAAIALIILILK